MARIRTIKPEIWTDEKFLSLTPLARLLFIGLWNFSDDYGRMPYSPFTIKLLILPADSADILALLGEIRGNEMIAVYQVDGKEYLQIINFSKHQKVDKRSPSKLPPPPLITPNPAESRRIPTTEGNGKEGNGKETPTADGDKTREKSVSPRGNSAEKVSHETTISLSTAGLWEGITPERRALWATAYPAVNLDAELASAAVWAMENPKNRKSNWGRFIANWLKRAQDRAPAAGGGKPSALAVTLMCEFRGDPFEPGREPCGMGGAKKGMLYAGRALCLHHERDLADRAAQKTDMPDEVRAALADLVKKKVAA